MREVLNANATALCLPSAFFSACRISEALQLRKESITANRIVFCKAITKGKLATREMIITSDLPPYLEAYKSPKPLNPYYFPGYKEHLKLNQAHKILRAAIERIGIVGASTHSCPKNSFNQTASARRSSQNYSRNIGA